MKRLLYPVILLTFAAALFAGCQDGGKSDSPVIAKVNKDVITQEDFLQEVEQVPEWARTQFEGLEGKTKFLDEIVKKELIYQNALDMKLDNDKKYIDKVEEFKKMTLVSLLLQKEVEEKASVSEEEVKAFFEENEAKFRIGTELKASHILVETEEEAKQLLDRINNGESFEKLAKEHSMDKGSAEKGGDLGYFGRGKMVPEFERALTSLKVGELGGPVKTRFGYHVVKLTDLKEGAPANYEQSKESIYKQLVNVKRKQLFDSYIEKLKSAGNVEIDQEALRSVRLPWEEESMEPAPETAPETEAESAE